MTTIGEDRAKVAADAKPRRRWLQFGLRSLLGMITLVAIALALVVVPAERQRRALLAIRDVDGTFAIADPDRKPGSIEKFLRGWLPEYYFYRIDSVWLTNTHATDASLAHLAGLTSLEELLLHNTEVTDAGLAHLAGLTSLEELSLFNTQVTDAGLAHLAELKSLKSLSLFGTQVTDAGLAHLAGLTSLEYLSLGETHVTDAGRAALQKSLPGCDMTY